MHVTFRYADPQHRLRGVRLEEEVRIPFDRLDFEYADGVWTLHTTTRHVARMEYRLELTHVDGRTESVCDPANPLRAPGAFGVKSVLEFPPYAAPDWLGTQPKGGNLPIEVVSRHLGATVTGRLWTPDGLAADEPAPLLVVHDGPEFDELSGITAYATAHLPGVRLALLDPGDRDRWYAANPAYARALVTEVLPALGPTTVTIGTGASLGGLALLHAHRSHPRAFDALFLQSGSFFHPDLDAHEARFPRFGPISRFVVDLHGAAAEPRPIPTVLTVGRIEENAANNRLMAATLRRLGVDVTLHEYADAHNYTAWRDTLHPYLTDTVTDAVERASA